MTTKKTDRTHVLYQQKPLTLVALVLDNSGSMGTLTGPAKQFHDETIAYLKSLRDTQDVRVSRVGFSSFVSVEQPLTPVDVYPPLPYYRASGGTALFDAIAQAIDHIGSLPGITGPDVIGRDVAFLVIGITDGEENQSRSYPTHLPQLIGEKIKGVVDTGRWTVGLNVPPGKKDWFVRTFPAIGADNVREWELTGEGLRETTQATQSGMGEYFEARTRGVTSVQTLYKATTDLSGVTADDLAKLTNQAGRFKQYAVDKEARVDEFVQAKTGKPYVVGAAFYQLTKPELVQVGKELLIMEKAKKLVVYGGKDARKVLGLPADGDVKVTPGNHANYDIYVQSRSVNRKLVRGTKVLVELAKQKADAPTWDHTAGGTK